MGLSFCICNTTSLEARTVVGYLLGLPQIVEKQNFAEAVCPRYDFRIEREKDLA